MLLIIFYTTIMLFVWNEKKNFSYYYETLLLQDWHHLQKEYDKLDSMFGNFISYNEIIKTVISQDIHYLAEKQRDIDSYINEPILNKDKIQTIFQNYLDRLCIITSKLYLNDYNSVNSKYLEKFACCIKLLHPEDIFSQKPINEIRFKTFVRSKMPNDKKYLDRLEDIGKKFDNYYENIIDNDNFKELILEKRWYYYINDYHKLFNAMNYRTSHPHSTKYYKSAISFPIIYRTESNNGLILGFLCFDNDIVNAFPSCSNEHEPHQINKIWEEFCCSQIDIISTFVYKYLSHNQQIKTTNNLLTVYNKIRNITL